jgi:hypothetical protein
MLTITLLSSPPKHEHVYLLVYITTHLDVESRQVVYGCEGRLGCTLDPPHGTLHAGPHALQHAHHA